MPSAVQPPLLSEVLPTFAEELRQLLTATGEPELAAQVSGLRIVDRCRCGDDFCATFYVRPKPNGSYGPNHRNVSLIPNEGMLILDVVWPEYPVISQRESKHTTNTRLVLPQGLNSREVALACCGHADLFLQGST
jgi:hypothetical protein